MSFNEQNSVEHFIIDQLTGINLNSVQNGQVGEHDVSYGGDARWRYVQPELLHREIEDVLLRRSLKNLCVG